MIFRLKRVLRLPAASPRSSSGRFSINRAVQLVATQPARMYNLYPRKGVIQVGAQADLVLFDPSVEHTVDREIWFSKAAACDRLYTGMTLKGHILQTMLRGNIVYRDGDVIGSAKTDLLFGTPRFMLRH